LGDYQEVSNNEASGTAIYQSASSARGGQYVGWLGNRRSNYLEWKDVYVQEAGEYTIQICATSQEPRSFIVEVNGENAGSIHVQTSDWNTFKEYSLTLHLNAGSNRIQLYNDKMWMPNIDYMTIQKKS
jgi:hypothetical protein